MFCKHAAFSQLSVGKKESEKREERGEEVLTPKQLGADKDGKLFWSIRKVFAQMLVDRICFQTWIVLKRNLAQLEKKYCLLQHTIVAIIENNSYFLYFNNSQERKTNRKYVVNTKTKQIRKFPLYEAPHCYILLPVLLNLSLSPFAWSSSFIRSRFSHSHSHEVHIQLCASVDKKYTIIQPVGYAPVFHKMKCYHHTHPTFEEDMVVCS